MKHSSLESTNPESMQLEDEENALYLAMPLLSKKNHSSKSESPRFSWILWATTSIIIIQTLSFTGITYFHGFVPVFSNPFIGPSLENIDDWGSKNPTKIIEDGEYWRVVSAIFCNVGILDLLFSIVVLLCLGYHLEERWGGCKFMFIYIMSGIGGNLFGTIFVPTAVSVGCGGCIFGLLGAMHVDIVYSIIHEQYQKKNDKKKKTIEDSPDNKHDVQNTHKKHYDSSNRDQDKDEDFFTEEIQDTYIIRSSYIILGFLIGVCLTTVIGIIQPNSFRMQKDWAVLYGGMMSGLILSLIWQFFVSLKDQESPMVLRVSYGFLIVAIPFLFDCLVSMEVSHSILKVM